MPILYHLIVNLVLFVFLTSVQYQQDQFAQVQIFSFAKLEQIVRIQITLKTYYFYNLERNFGVEALPTKYP